MEKERLIETETPPEQFGGTKIQPAERRGPFERVLSLLPSATEIVYALGAERRLIGVTHECDYPIEAHEKPRMTSARIDSTMASDEIDALVRSQLEDTGTLYALDLDRVRELRPDLVLTQQLCTVCAVGYGSVVEAMASLPEPPDIINLEPRTLAEVFDTFIQVADLLGVPESGKRLVATLRSRLDAIEPLPKPARVALFEWLIPPFRAGHWMPELVQHAGAEPVFALPGTHSQSTSWEEIAAQPFDVLAASCCGFNVERAMEDVNSCEGLRALRRERPELRVIVLDGSHFFSRPGPRLVESAQILNAALRGLPPDQAGASIPAPYREV